MDEPIQESWSRRERQIMDAIYALGEGGVADVVERIEEPEAYESVRVTLGILERKGYLEHRQEGNRNIYFPVIPASEARKSAMQHLARTFFGGSAARAALAFLDLEGSEVDAEALERLVRRMEEDDAEGDR